MLPKSLSAKTVDQIVCTKMLGEKASAKTTSKNDSTEMLPKKCIRKNSRSKCPYWNARGKSIPNNLPVKMTVLKMYPQNEKTTFK